MNEIELREGVLLTLASIAPEVDPLALRADQLLRNQVDLDSFDWLNFLLGLHQRFKIDIPESEYERLATLNDIVSYLKPRVA